MKKERAQVTANMVVSFPQSEVLALCAEYGPQLRVDLVIDPPLVGKYVMGAIAWNESALGADCTPRHEPAWDLGGVYAGEPEQAALLKEYGRAAASSYGPWQLMFYNCPGFTPDELTSDADACARCFLAYFNGYIQRKGAITLEQIGQAYNLGHVTEDPPESVQQYTKNLALHYTAVAKLF
jgi:hypothetical protein